MNISEQLDLLTNIKSDIKDAIEYDGVDVPSNTPFRGYANLIKKIKSPVLIDKTITKNGIYLPADDEADGYKKVIVNVPGVPVTREKIEREVDDWYACSPYFRDDLTRSITDDSVCWQGILNSHLTQTGGSMSPDMVYTGGNGYGISSDIVLPLNTADSWEFGTVYTYNRANSGEYPAILGSSSNVYVPRLFIVKGTNRVHTSISSNDSSWDIANGEATSLYLTDSITYYIKYGFDGSSYYVLYNTTGWGDDFTTAKTISNSNKASCISPFTLMNSLSSIDTGVAYNSGSMKLLETYWKINGAEYLRCATKQFY